MLSYWQIGSVYGMGTEIEAPKESHLSRQVAPISITISLFALVLLIAIFEGRNIGGGFIEAVSLICLSAMVPACLARTTSLLPLGSGTARVISFTAILIALSFVANLLAPTYFSNFFVTTFVIVGLVCSTLDESELLEEASVFLSVVLGMRLAAFYAAGLEISQDPSSAYIDAAREAIGSAFFSFWLAAISLGFLVLVCIRGNFENAGKGNLLSGIPLANKDFSVIAYSSLSFAGFMIPLIWIGQLETVQEFSEGSHLGIVWAIFSTIILLLHSFFRSEGWNVLGALLAVNWILYSIGHIHEIGNELPSLFAQDGFIGAFSWFFLWFWMNFFAIFFASRGVFGDIAPRREKGQFRVWWDSNSYPVMISLALIVALVVRSAWNVIPAMNANGTGLWDMTGGSDPWYMKRIVDYVIAERSHLIFDHDRAYPAGGINPRPPLFSWSLAMVGLGLSWVLEMPASETVWWSMAALPAIYGALIVLPIAGIATRAHGKRAGIIAAWLIALMPGHMSRSTFAMSDHDSFAMLFLAIAFYFWMRALEGVDGKKTFQSASSNPLYVIAGIRETWRRNPQMMANATMSGIAFSVMALGWKGFVYGPGILFLAYSFQVAVNIFRGRDSLQFTSAALQMMLTATLIPIPFYAWPGLELIFAPSGLQPMFYIIGFTFAVGWVSSSFRDKPWLLVIMSGSALFGSILALLFILQQAELYNGWDILFTGGFYFSKNKIFGTIGEAQAPDRGVLFASYGPIVAIIAICCAFVLLWRGSRRNRSGLTLLGLWTIIATYMAWTAGRFIINATPAMAVVGGIGISMLWGAANFPAFSKVWRNSGIGTPRSRFRSIWPASKARPGVPAVVMVILMISSQHATFGIDSGIPRGEQSAYEVDQSLYDIAPDILRHEFVVPLLDWGFSAMNNEPYKPGEAGLWYMGTFGPSFNSQGWNEAYNWLSQQDSEQEFSERPAFVSWWDYGFQALASGQHPTVADNFQSGIPNSGAMLLSAGQEDTLSLFIATLAIGDRKLNDGKMSEEFGAVLDSYMSTSQVNEFDEIMSNGDLGFVLDRSMALVATYGDSELLMGKSLSENGLPLEGDSWSVVKNGELVAGPTNNESEALAEFDIARGSSSSYEIHDLDDASHFDLGGYRYTRDLVDDYYDISTGLHRANAKFGMMRAFLISAFTLEDLVGIYDGISSIDTYEVSNYGDSHGETTTRNHEIRYFAVDNRLFPLGGMYYQDYQDYHRGQTTGIFHAPTHLSGLDLDNYISTTYQTNQGLKTPQEYNDQYLEDLRSQASGASTAEDMIQMTDIDYQHRDIFFETMVARTYVGYGTSTLGLQSVGGQLGDAEAPSTWIAPSAISGSPGSYLEGALALPGAMMNHFVLSNWYDPTDGANCEKNETGANINQYCGTIYDSNRNVKVLKYYSGATLEGTVTLEGEGPVPSARILIERDAFSGEDAVDNDSRTFWIPIGKTQADQNGHFSFTAPSGKIRITAFSGNPDLDEARNSIITSGIGNSMFELFTENSENRNINPISGILGGVYGSTWLSETIVNISGLEGHSNGKSVIEAQITVPTSSAAGLLTWSGESDFDGEPVSDVGVILTPESSEISIQPYQTRTSNGSMQGESLIFSGIGEVTFSGEGTVISEGAISVSEFTGNHTQTIYDNHSISGDGWFSGKGTIVGNVPGVYPVCVNNSVPHGETVCSEGDELFILNGSVSASGKFTSEGVSQFSRELFQTSLIGSGTFITDPSHDLEQYGTFNGTGSFSGNGVFSGPMVSPGSFHVVDALPGDYSITIDFGDKQVELDEIFSIPLIPSPSQYPVTISAGAIKGEVVLENGDALSTQVSIFPDNSSSEDSIAECDGVVTQACFISPDEDGAFSVGPIVPGTFVAQIDVDEDGFPEISQTYIFESNVGTLESFPSRVPATSDIEFTLEDEGESVDNLELIFKSQNQSVQPVHAIFDNSSKSYYAELLPGEWILNYTLSEDKQLWQRIEVGTDDIIESFDFLISQVVNGIIVDEGNKEDPNQPASPIPNQEVVFHWSGFTLSAFSDSSGQFTIILPRGEIVHATVERAVGAGGFIANGTKFVVSEGMDNLTLELTESMIVLGSVGLNREGNSYNQGIPGWEPISAQAIDMDAEIATSVIWREEVDELGRFEMILPLGNWSFSLDAGEIGSSSTENIEINSTSVDMSTELVLFPQSNSSVTIDFFIDHNGDNNASNGSYVTYPFEIKPLTPKGLGLAINSSDSRWTSTGVAEISLEPGRYRIVVERANSSADEPFDTLYDMNEIFDVPLGSTGIERSVIFEPLWLVNITLRNESGDILPNHEIKLEDIENGWIQTFITDDDGRIVEYINEGEWVLVVEEFETFPGVFEGLRRSISISQENAGNRQTFFTTELAVATISLQYDGPPVSAMEEVGVTFSSQDGLGSLTKTVADWSNDVVIRLTPGLWNIEMNHTTEDGVRFVIENTTLAESGVFVGMSPIIIDIVSFVQLSGQIFWDLDEDGLPGFSEGLANASVNLSSEDGTSNYNLTSNSNGEWSIFLPQQGVWGLSVSKEGFGTEDDQVTLSSTSLRIETEISAGEVEASGSLSYIDESCISSGDWEVQLIPSHGIVRDSILIEGNEQGSWSTNIQPGSWIAYSYSISSSQSCVGLVSIDSLEVGVEGASIDSSLTLGGTVNVDTNWIDLSGNDHDLTEIENYDLRMEFGGLSWSQELNENGALSLLLPPGTAQASTEFEVDENGINVTYSGGKGITVRAGQESPLRTLTIDRVSKQDIIATVLTDSRIEVQKLNPSCQEGCEFEMAEFTISIHYDGHNSFDTYDAVATVPGTDGILWNVEFQNSTGNWTQSLNFDLGLDNENQREILVRVTPANSSYAHDFVDGHNIIVKISTSQGYSTQVELVVDVPAIRGLELNNEQSIFFDPEDENVILSIPFSNLGNADESFSFEFGYSDWWDILGPMEQPVSPFADGLASFTLIRNSDQPLPEEYTETLEFTVSDLFLNSYLGQVNLIADSAILSIKGEDVRLLGQPFPTYGVVETYAVEITNAGKVDAEGVTLLATLCHDIECNSVVGVNSSSTSDVLAMNESTFFISMDYTQFDQREKFYILFEIEGEDLSEQAQACESSKSEGKPSCIEEADLFVASESNENLKYMAYVFILLLLGALIYFTRRPGRRVSAPF